MTDKSREIANKALTQVAVITKRRAFMPEYQAGISDADALGVAMLPRVAIEREVQRGELRQIRVDGMETPQREIALIYRQSRPLSRAAQAFVHLLEERYGVHAPSSDQAPPHQ